MTVREEVHRLVEDLPEGDLITVKRVLQGLRMSEEPLRIPSRETAEERRERVYALAGSAANLPGCVDEFLIRKHEDTEREEQRDLRPRDGVA
jgi:hypothetical protein